MKKLFLLVVLAAGSMQLAEAQSYGTKIGQTYYDLQSNYSSANRLVRLPNGNLSATWTESCNTDPGVCPSCPYATRGAGYNFYNGTTWVHGPDGTCDEPGADFGVFSGRVGWPEIMVFPSGKEMIIAHTPLTAVSRTTAGSGGMTAWTANTNLPISPAPGNGVETNTWPRAVNVGSTIHMIATCQPCTTASGVIGPIGYFRSQDEGLTWDKVDEALPGVSAPDFANIGADGYAIHANGQNVAIVAGSGGNQWALWKSTNGGDTFTKTAIRSFSINDTVDIGSAQYAGYETNDAYHSVLVDNNGVAHVWAGYILGGVDKTTTPPSYSVYYPLASEGMWYWNDGSMMGMAPELIVEEREDVHAPGSGMNWIGDGSYVTPALRSPYAGSLTSMPNAALAANGDIYLVYSGIVEGTSNTLDSTGQSFRDLYVMMRSAAGAWGDPMNIGVLAGAGRTDFEEEVFPSVAKTIGSDNLLHMIFQHDDEPGLHVRIEYDPETLNSIVYHSLDVTVLGAEGTIADKLNGIKAYPNPTTGRATLQLDLKTDASVSVRVTNILGQEVTTLPAAQLPAGKSSLNLDLSAQPAGIYLYTVITDGFATTQRLVKE